MSMKQWKNALGDHLPLSRVPHEIGQPSIKIVKAIKTGRLRLHTFKAGDGRVFQAVRTRDLDAYKQYLENPQPEITIEGMKRAFREMADSA